MIQSRRQTSNNLQKIPVGGEFGFSKSLNLPIQSLPIHTVTSSGRDALRAVLDNWPNRRKILMSAYTCDSILRAIRLDTSLELAFLEISPSFYPDLRSIEQSMISDLNESILVIGNLFGIPYPEEIKKSIHVLRMSGLIVVEDRTHNLFSQTQWLDADGWFASGRKWIPSAGLGMYFPANGSTTRTLNWIGMILSIMYRNTLMRLLSKILKRRRTRNKIVQELRRTDDSLGLRKSYVPIFGSRRVIRISQRNTSNYQDRIEKCSYLIGQLGSCKNVKVINDVTQSRLVPFNLTVRVEENRDALRKYLSQRQIFLPVLWPVSDDLRQGFPAAWKLSQEILSIPIDHRYGKRELERVCREIQCFEARTESERDG
jgi:hypothetical protein